MKQFQYKIVNELEEEEIKKLPWKDWFVGTDILDVHFDILTYDPDWKGATTGCIYRVKETA